MGEMKTASMDRTLFSCVQNSRFLQLTYLLFLAMLMMIAFLAWTVYSFPTGEIVSTPPEKRCVLRAPNGTIITLPQNVNSTSQRNIVSILPEKSNSTRMREMNDYYNNLTEAELTERVNRLSLAPWTTPDDILKHPYFTPGQAEVERYTNSVLRQPTSACGGRPVLILVLSHPKDVIMRRTIRETWGSVAKGQSWPGKPLVIPVKLLFVLGLPKETGNNTKQKIADANSDDILQFEMVDSYRNLTRKVLLAFGWTMNVCQEVEFILKVDQDVIPNIPLLLALFKQQGSGSAIIYGNTYSEGFIDRSPASSWYVPESVLPITKFPPYFSGVTYALTRSAADAVVKLSTRYQYVAVEDVFITGILAAVGSVQRIHVEAFARWGFPPPHACDLVLDKIYTGTSLTQLSLQLLWQNLTQADDLACYYSCF